MKKLLIEKLFKGSPSGITHQLFRVFAVQMLFISMITVLGVYIAAKVVEGVMMRAALEGEANHFWSLYEDNKNQPLPDTDNLIGYLAVNDDFSSVPKKLMEVRPGYGRIKLEQNQPLVFVQKKDGDTLFLVFDEQSVSRLSLYFGVFPLSLALVVLYISAWFAYRQSQKAVSPLVRLAKSMQNFDIYNQDLANLDLDKVRQSPKNDEVDILIDALAGFTHEINQLLERERRFTRDASHELRTPLSVIQGSAEWINNNSNLSKHQKSAVERILRTARDMTHLVNALLMLSRGVKKLTTESVDVVALIQAMVTSVELTHNQDRHIELELVGNDNLLLHTSPEGLNMVFGNLLRNAYSYTHKGKVKITLNDNSVSIANIGEGVARDIGEEIFEPFYRGAGVSRDSGFGVGLDIVKRLCDHFDWSISHSYSSTDGNVFTLVFHGKGN